MKRIIILWLVACITATRLQGQDLTLGSVEEALRIAKERNKDYKIYVLNQQRAEQEYRQSRASRYPTLSYSFNGQLNLQLPATPLPGELFGQPGETVILQVGQNYQYNSGFTLSKNLLDLEDHFQRKAAALNTRQAETDIHVFQEFLAEQVSTYYYTALVTRRAIEIGEEDIRTAEKITALSENKFEEGIIDQLTLNQAQINEKSVRQSLYAHQQLENKCLIELKKLLNLRNEDSLILEDRFDYYFPELFTADQLKIDPALEAATLQTEQSALRIKQSRSSMLPKLQLTSYFGQQLFSDDFELAIGQDAWTPFNYLGVSLSVPLFAGFNKRAEVKKNKFNFDIAQHEKEKAEEQAKLNDALLISDYSYSLENARSALETFELYRENENLTLQKYEQGILSLDAYLASFEDYIRAEHNYLNAMSTLYNYYSQILPRIQP
jgi:outer membrane protein TolC